MTKLFAILKTIQIKEKRLKLKALLLNKKHGLKVLEIINILYRKVLKELIIKLYESLILPREKHSIRNVKNAQ